MARRSAGILLYRVVDGVPMVLLIHPGGPYWANKDLGARTIPKGLIEPGAGDFEVGRLQSNLFELEWPPRSGEMRSFPEVDRAGWLGLAAARQKILAGQAPLIDRLVAVLATKSS
jgi:predicted NUDIX family NTP pyrophosphohydrolase